ncbi:MAG: N-acetylglucosamine-6-phosphate deacetylase [Sedimentisphaerales bacterium]|nr:N-acetylglucosamine-6-phosphate deacetylase [Sedimentisphaerales bacterium]
MASLLIRNCRLYNASQAASDSCVLIRDGKIARVGHPDKPVKADQVLDAQGRILAPGLIDVHIQGAGGADVLDATPEALQTISRTCARFGVTGFLATTVYRAGEHNRHLEVAAECTGRDLGGARLLGTHLEGPFISLEKKGMILPTCVLEPLAIALGDIYALLGNTLKIMTIAPELPGGLDMIKALVEHGTIASFGHSNATYEQTMQGFDAGITHVTHLFNAMPSLHHRDPGPLAAIFERAGVTCQVIADGVHIHPSVLRLVYHTLGPGRFITITDGMQAMGLPDGPYVYNGIEYEARDGAARYKDGTLIGTAVGLNQMLARLMRFTGCTLATAIHTVTKNAAEVLGVTSTKGSISKGKDADLVILNGDLSVYATIVGGNVVYQSP